MQNQLQVAVRRQEQELPMDGDQNNVPLPIQVDDDSDDEDDEPAIAQPPARPIRARRQNPRYFGPDYVNAMENSENDFGQLNDEEAFIACLGFITGNEASSQAQFYGALHAYKTDEDDILLGMHPLAFMAKANAEVSPNFHQAMNGPDAEAFIVQCKMRWKV